MAFFDDMTEQEIRQNKAIRGYIVRALAKGNQNSLLVRQVTNALLADNLITVPDISKQLSYLEDGGYIEFTDKRATAYNAYRRDAVIKLPDDIKTELDVRLADTANTYEDLSTWLKAEGYEISKSAIGRYAIRSTQAAQRVAETLQRTQAIAQAVEAHPDLDYTKAASMVLMDGLMQRVSTAEDDFAEMPLDKAGRLIASLARNATYEKRVRQDMKKKAELAFDQLEAELMAAIKQHPELAGELHDVLSRAREKVLDDGED